VTVGFYSLLSVWQIRPPSDQSPKVDEEVEPRINTDAKDGWAPQQPEGPSL